MFLVTNACVALLSGLKVLLIFVTSWDHLTISFILYFSKINMLSPGVADFTGSSIITNWYIKYGPINIQGNVTQYLKSCNYEFCLFLQSYMIAASGHSSREWDFYSTTTSRVWGSWFISTYWEWYLHCKDGLYLSYGFIFAVNIYLLYISLLIGYLDKKHWSFPLSVGF